MRLTLTESEARDIFEGVDQESLAEGISDFLKRFRLKKFEAYFFQKGNTTVYFVKSGSTKDFIKAVFINDKLETTQKYSTAAEMESDIKSLEGAGYKIVTETGVKSFLKMIVRSIGRLLKAGSLLTIIFGSLAIFAVASAGGLGLMIAPVLTAVMAVEATVQYMAGRWLVKAGSRPKALERDHGKVAAALRESIVEGDPQDARESINALVRDIIKESVEPQPLNESISLVFGGILAVSGWAWVRGTLRKVRNDTLLLKFLEEQDPQGVIQKQIPEQLKRFKLVRGLADLEMMEKAVEKSLKSLEALEGRIDKFVDAHTKEVPDVSDKIFIRDPQREASQLKAFIREFVRNARDSFEREVDIKRDELLT